jgi:hypothetical protein
MFSAVAIMALVLSPVLIPLIITGFRFLAEVQRKRTYARLEQKLDREHLADGVGRASKPSMSTTW